MFTDYDAAEEVSHRCSGVVATDQSLSLAVQSPVNFNITVLVPRGSSIASAQGLKVGRPHATGLRVYMQVPAAASFLATP